MSEALTLAKSAMEAIQRSRARKGAMRGAAADEVASLARLTEATRIALHKVRGLAERSELGMRERLKTSVADMETVADIWRAAWADVRFDLDRYLDPAVVEVLRSVRHEALKHVDSVIGQCCVLIDQVEALPGSGEKDASSRTGRLFEAVNHALVTLDAVSSGLRMAHDLIENGGVGSSGTR